MLIDSRFLRWKINLSQLKLYGTDYEWVCHLETESNNIKTATKTATSFDEINTAVQVVVNQFADIKPPKSAFFFDKHDKHYINRSEQARPQLSIMPLPNIKTANMITMSDWIFRCKHSGNSADKAAIS